MRLITGLVLLLIGLSANAAGWQESFLKDQKQIGDINGQPVWICTYSVGFGDDFRIRVRMNEWSCPVSIKYNVELNKWRK